MYAEQKALREQANKDAEDALKESEEAFQEWWDNLNEIEAAEAEKNYQKRMERLHRELDAIQAQNEAQEDEKKEYFKEIEDLDEANFQKTLSLQELELRSVQDQYFRLIELAEIYGADKTKLEEDLAIQEANIKKKYEEAAADDAIAKAELVKESKLELAQSTLNGLSVLTQIAEENQLVSAKKSFQIQKAISITQATIQGYVAVQKTLSEPALPFPANVIAAAAIGITSAATVAAIAAKKFDAGGGGGGSAPSVGGGGASTSSAGGGGAPQFNTVGTSGFNQVAGSIANQNQEPIKAYVVANDVTSQQSLDRNSRDKSSF